MKSPEHKPPKDHKVLKSGNIVCVPGGEPGNIVGVCYGILMNLVFIDQPSRC